MQKEIQPDFFKLLISGITGKVAKPISANVEWRLIERLAIQHEVLPIVLSGYQNYYNTHDTIVLPKPIEEAQLLRWISYALKTRNTQEQNERACCDFVELIKMPCVVLKGLDYARLWKQKRWRSSCDIDIIALPNKHCAFDTCSFLHLNQKATDSGCTVLSNGHYKHSTIIHNGWTIENHQYLTTFDNTKRGILIERELRELLRSDYEKDKLKTINGTNYGFVPNANFTALYILLHAHHHFFWEGFSIKQILDWYFFISAEETNIDLDYIQSVLKGAGLNKFYDLITSFCVRYLGLRTNLPYDSNSTTEDKFCAELFSSTSSDRKLIMLAHRFYKMWRFRMFLGEGVGVRIINTLLYNRLHFSPKL